MKSESIAETMEFFDQHFKGTKMLATSFEGLTPKEAQEEALGPIKCIKCNNGWCSVSQRKRG